MRLTKKNIAHYLLDKGFLDDEIIVDGQFRLTQAQSRNCIFNIALGNNGGLFVKQLVAMDPQNVYLMQKDATVHYLIHQSDIYPELKQYTPKYYGYDPKTNVFVTHFFSNAYNLYEHYLNEKKLSTAHPKELARILSLYSKDIQSELPSNTSLQFFNRQLPWILTIENSFNMGSNAVIQTIAKDKRLLNGLIKLKKDWKGNSLVHGDIKLVNFLLVTENNEEQIKLIDWEIANLGDPLWDLSGLIQSYLTIWGSTRKPQSETEPMPGFEFLELGEIKTCISDLWNEYARLHGWTKKEKRTKLKKVAQYTAARILQTAYEANQFKPNEMSLAATQLMEMSRNIFKSPLDAASNLMGIKI